MAVFNYKVVDKMVRIKKVPLRPRTEMERRRS